MLNKLVMGLDVSTSIIGVTVLDPTIEVKDELKHVVTLTHIDFKKCKTLFDKADRVAEFFDEYILQHPTHTIGELAIEEPLMGFSKGMSSAATITTLMRFNGIVSYIARQWFSIEPTYISASHARKVCGIKIQRFAVCKKSAKVQTFEHMQEHDLKLCKWPNKLRSNNIVDYAMDQTDAYVIARAYCIENVGE